MNGPIHIVGGGIIGLCSAYYLNKAGYAVTIIDASNITDGTSFGNAGMVVPSHFIPFAAPGIISKGIRWMFDSKSPFYIKPRLNLELAQWLWKFYKSCSKKHVTNSVHLLKDYNELSKHLYKEMAVELGGEAAFCERGLMMLCQTKKALLEETEVADMANRIGVQAITLNQSEIQEKNLDCQVHALGGIWYPGDGHIYSNRFMFALVDHLKKQGVHFRLNTKVTNVNTKNGKIESIQTTANETIQTDQLILACGTWTKYLLKKIGIDLLLQDGKGYSITMSEAISKPSIPSILAEAKVAMTPMGKDLRITGTLELSNLSKKINLKRVQGFLEAVPKYFPSITPNSKPPLEEIWTGYRPCSPDGIPYMGKIENYDNLIVATGHAMTGMSLGPASGKIVAELIGRNKTSIPLDKMSLAR